MQQSHGLFVTAKLLVSTACSRDQTQLQCALYALYYVYTWNIQFPCF